MLRDRGADQQCTIVIGITAIDIEEDADDSKHLPRGGGGGEWSSSLRRVEGGAAGGGLSEIKPIFLIVYIDSVVVHGAVCVFGGAAGVN